MSANMLGIDIRTTTVYITDVRRGRPVSSIEEELPDFCVRNGQIVAYNALAEFLREVKRKHKIRRKDVAMTLPEEVCVIRRVRLPRMTVAQLKVNLPYEFHYYIQGNPGDYIFDYAVIRIEADAMELMACAVEKKIADRYQTMLKKAGFRLVRLVPEEIAFQNIVMPPEEARKRLAQAGKADKAGRKQADKTAKAARAKKPAKVKADKKTKRTGPKTNEELAQLAAEEARKNGVLFDQQPPLPTPGYLNPAAEQGLVSGQTSDQAAVPQTSYLQQVGAMNGGGASWAAGQALTSAPAGPETAPAPAPQTTPAPAPQTTPAPAPQTTPSQPLSQPPAAEEQAWGKDFAVLYLGPAQTKLHFFSKGSYEITRILDTSAQSIVDLVSSNRGMDPHMARLRLRENQDGLVQSEEVQREMDSMATEIMRVMNFYNYNNPRNTLERIHYCGSDQIAEQMKDRVRSATQMDLVPLTDLIPDGEKVPGLGLAPQTWGATVS